MSSVRLERDAGAVVFLGGVNAMPMMYALELRKKGFDVCYVVDRPMEDKLSRPENHFPSVEYPYPKWIAEWLLPTQMLLAFFPRFLAVVIRISLYFRGVRQPQVFVLNGFFCCLAPFLGAGVRKVFLSSGSDLDSWADTGKDNKLPTTFARRSVFKFFPAFLARPLIRMVMRRQFRGARNCDVVAYFPRGFSTAGDKVVSDLEAAGCKVVQRYDVSFDPLVNQPRGDVAGHDKLVIFSGVRFTFKTFPDGNDEYNKGNDVMIRGIAKFHEQFKNIEVHFVEKGEDVSVAKALCEELGLKNSVTWYPEMKFSELLGLYRIADVCFDQTGSHWVGAIGCYALWLGKPLIANDRKAIDAGLWAAGSPILTASTPDEVCNHLVALVSRPYRKAVAEASRNFAEKHLGPERALNLIFDFDPPC
jgi:glycosyltransferase involved in cell wall biosynthesis